MRRTAATAAILAGLLVFAACGGDGAGSGEPTAGSGDDSSGTIAATAAPRPGSDGDVDIAGLQIPVAGPSIVKTASVSIEVEEDGFDDAFGRAVEIAGAHGGFVDSSATRGAELKSGRITLRVPADAFEAAYAEILAIGEVQEQEFTGRDVSAEFVDLDARIRHLEAQEELLLGFLGKAATIAGSLDVQRTLSEVQLQIERLVGQRRSLQDRADYSAITLEISEPDAEPVSPDHPEVATGVSNPDLSEAWDRSKAAFFSVLYGLILAVGVAAPFAVAAALTLMVLWWMRRRRTVEEPSAPAA